MSSAVCGWVNLQDRVCVSVVPVTTVSVSCHHLAAGLTRHMLSCRTDRQPTTPTALVHMSHALPTYTRCLCSVFTWDYYYYFASAAVTVDFSHMTASSSAQSTFKFCLWACVNNVVHGLLLASITRRWLDETPYVQVSMTWALTCPKMVHQKPCMTREIETWLSDSRVGNYSVVDHRSRRPVLSPPCNCVDRCHVWPCWDYWWGQAVCDCGSVSIEGECLQATCWLCKVPLQHPRDSVTVISTFVVSK